MRQRSHDSQRLSRVVEHSSQAREAILIPLFAQRPGLVLDNVFIYRRHQSPGGLQRARKLELIEQSAEVLDRPASRLNDGIIGAGPRRRMRWVWHLTLE